MKLVSHAQIQKPKIKQKYHLLYFESFIILLKIVLINLENTKNKRNLILNYYSEIHLVIQGRGEKKFLGDNFNTEPSEVYINGIKNDSCKKKCDLNRDKNNITLRFEKQIESLQSMFDTLPNIIEIDISNFDTSKVKTMNRMFCDCKDLEKIIFGKINTSSVEDMYALFNGLSKLTSIDLSNFNTSRVKTMSFLFSGCSNLKFLDLSNFITYSINQIEYMFQSCSSLIFLNLKSFKFGNSIMMNGVFYLININVKYCTEDIKLKNYISTNYHIESACDNICFKENIKIDIINKCIESCINNGYEYEYNNICYEKCPTNTYAIFCDGDKCKDNTKINYHLSTNLCIYRRVVLGTMILTKRKEKIILVYGYTPLAGETREVRFGRSRAVS